MYSNFNDNGEVIRKRFTQQHLNYIVSGVTQGYNMAFKLAEQVPWIYQTIRGRAKLPHLRNVAIEVMLLEMAALGEIPLVGHEVWNKKKTHSYAELRSTNCIMTVNYVHRPAQFPRKAFFRKALSENNIQQSLWEEYEEPNKSNILYTVLTHGGNDDKLLFASIGAPVPGFMKWGARLPIFRWQDIRAAEKTDMAVQKMAKKPSLKKQILERLNTNEREEG